MGGSVKVRNKNGTERERQYNFRNRCVINLPKTISENQTALFNNVKLTRLVSQRQWLIGNQGFRFYIPEDTSLEYICSQPDANGLHTCSNLPPYTVNGVKYVRIL